MPVCVPCMGLGVRHIQYSLYAFLISIEFWLQELAIKSLLKIDADSSSSSSGGQYLNVSKEEMATVQQMVFLCFAVGRITSAFVCLKFNNKYLLIGLIVFESLVVLISFWFIKQMNIVFFLMFFGSVSFSRSFHWTLVFNMMSKWMTPTEYTTAYALMIVTRETLSFVMKFFLASTKDVDQSRLFLFVVTVFYIAWAMLFLVFGAEGPETSFLLSRIEHAYLAKCIGPRKKSRCSSKAPWKSIFGTLILYGWLFADFGRECCVTVISDGFQIVLEELAGASLAGIQVSLCLAYLAILGSAVLSDKLIVKELLTPGQVRKIYSSVGCCGASISMILAAYSERTSPTFAFIVVGQVFSSITAIGQPLCIFDISPNYAAVIFAIFTFLRNILFASRTILDVRLKIYPITMDNFDNVFYRYGFLVFFTNLIFLLCGPIERKPFDTYDTHDWTKESIISYP